MTVSKTIALSSVLPSLRRAVGRSTQNGTTKRWLPMSPSVPVPNSIQLRQWSPPHATLAEMPSTASPLPSDTGGPATCHRFAAADVRRPRFVGTLLGQPGPLPFSLRNAAERGRDFWIKLFCMHSTCGRKGSGVRPSRVELGRLDGGETCRRMGLAAEVGASASKKDAPPSAEGRLRLSRRAGSSLPAVEPAQIDRRLAGSGLPSSEQGSVRPSTNTHSMTRRLV